MKSDYQEYERKKSIELINTSSLFEQEKAGKMFMRSERDFVLMNGLMNLISSVRPDIVDYFSKNNIAWWGGSKPTGHVLSSQIACLNHLFPIRNDKNAVLEMIKLVSSDFIDVLEITTDKFQKGYIQFEAVSENDNLNEGKPTRGNNCTSIDALVYALHNDGSKWLIPIEWKYTEHYDNQNKAIEGYKVDPINCKGEIRKKRYTTLINNSVQLKSTDHSCYYFEPFYQLMRQTLWTEQMIKNKEKETLKADNYFHVHIIPSENKDLLNKTYKCSGKDMESTWKLHLNDNNKYIIFTPEKFLSNSLNDSKYNMIKNYLTERYWTK